jgi:hypothetical protein
VDRFLDFDGKGIVWSNKEDIVIRSCKQTNCSVHKDDRFSGPRGGINSAVADMVSCNQVPLLLVKPKRANLTKAGSIVDHGFQAPAEKILPALVHACPLHVRRRPESTKFVKGQAAYIGHLETHKVTLGLEHTLQKKRGNGENRF